MRLDKCHASYVNLTLMPMLSLSDDLYAFLSKTMSRLLGKVFVFEFVKLLFLQVGYMTP